MAMKVLQKDMEELKLSFEFMSSKVDTIMKQQAVITELIGEVKQLKQSNIEQNKKIVSLENRLDSLEQYSRMNDVIIAGLKIKPRSYRQAVQGLASEGNLEHEETTEEQVKTFLQSKDIVIDIDNIEACHTLPTKSLNDKPVIPSIIVRFTNRKNKINLLKQGRKLKGTNVYINEHLTKKNGEIAKKARALKKNDKIQSTWTAGCKVFIKPIGAAESSHGLCISGIEQLKRYE